MKQTLHSNECISAEKQSAEFNLKSYREEVFFIISLKTVFENLNLVKSYDEINPNVLYLIYGKNIRIRNKEVGSGK